MNVTDIQHVRGEILTQSSSQRFLALRLLIEGEASEDVRL
jgi:hypothetical protein